MDFPDITKTAVSLILTRQVERVALVCRGLCIAANKVPGIPAAVS